MLVSPDRGTCTCSFRQTDTSAKPASPQARACAVCGTRSSDLSRILLRTKGAESSKWVRVCATCKPGAERKARKQGGECVAAAGAEEWLQCAGETAAEQWLRGAGELRDQRGRERDRDRPPPSQDLADAARVMALPDSAPPSPVAHHAHQKPPSTTGCMWTLIQQQTPVWTSQCSGAATQQKQGNSFAAPRSTPYGGSATHTAPLLPDIPPPPGRPGEVVAAPPPPPHAAPRLETLPLAEQKRLLGEKLQAHRMVAACGESADKMISVLLECDNAEIVNLLNFPEGMQRKLQELQAADLPADPAPATPSSAAGAPAQGTPPQQLLRRESQVLQRSPARMLALQHCRMHGGVHRAEVTEEDLQALDGLISTMQVAEAQDVLGVPADASPNDVDMAAKRRMADLHPDTAPAAVKSKRALMKSRALRFYIINHARSVLLGEAVGAKPRSPQPLQLLDSRPSQEAQSWKVGDLCWVLTTRVGEDPDSASLHWLAAKVSRADATAFQVAGDAAGSGWRFSKWDGACCELSEAEVNSELCPRDVKQTAPPYPDPEDDASK
eukprot:gene5025-20869_t